MFTGIVTHRGIVREVLPGEGGARRLVIEPRPPFGGTAHGFPSLAPTTDGGGDRLAPGASVAVDGVCLTIAALGSGGRDLPAPDRETPASRTPPGGTTPDSATPDSATPDSATPDSAAPDIAAALLAFDVVPQTLRLTTLGERVVGDAVHLERALRAGEELGGHWVQGHVEGTGEVASVDACGDDVRLVVRLGPSLFCGMLPKGSVCLDGVSLTVGEVWRETGDEGGRIACYLVPHTLAVTNLGAHAPGERLNVEPDVLGRWVEHHLRQRLEAADAWVEARSQGGRS